MTTKTIASLALLKARYDVDHEDIVDSFKSFLLLTLTRWSGDIVKSEDVQMSILDEYGLNLPQHVIHLILHRIVKDGFLQKDQKKYRIIKRPDQTKFNTFLEVQANAIKNQLETIASLVNYANQNLNVILTDEEAEIAIYDYIDQYSIECVKAYSGGSIVPVSGKSVKNANFIVSSYINYVSASDPFKFHYIVTVVVGRMISNALLGEDLYDIKMKFDNSTVYLDAPLVLKLLGVLGDAEKNATKEMVEIIKDVGGKVSIFEHTRDEVDYILRSAEKYLDVPNGGYGNVIFNLRECGKTASDIALLRAQMDDVVVGMEITLSTTPSYVATFQVDERELELEMATAGLLYSNDVAKRKDINSIRSIYVLRKSHFPRKIEKCTAIFVTNNSGLARAATAYGKHHEESKEISTVITDFSLTNLIWLKCPVAHADVPKKLIAANAYAALKPSEGLWAAFVTEINKLEQGHKISSSQHQFLRYDLKVRNDLMDLTLGGEDVLTLDKIYKILEIREQEVVAPYEKALAVANEEKNEVMQNYATLNTNIRVARAKADSISRKISAAVKAGLILVSVILISYVNGWGFDAKAVDNLSLGTRYILKFGSVVIGIFTVLGQVYGTTMWNPINLFATGLEKLLSRLLFGLLHKEDV